VEQCFSISVVAENCRFVWVDQSSSPNFYTHPDSSAWSGFTSATN